MSGRVADASWGIDLTRLASEQVRWLVSRIEPLLLVMLAAHYLLRGPVESAGIEPDVARWPSPAWR